MKIPNSMLFRACLYPSNDIAGYYVAHCLELDLIGEGPTPKDALIELIQAIELQIAECGNNSEFFFPAPNEIWQQYSRAINAGRVIMQRIVRQAFNGIAPSHARYIPRFENVVATSSVPKQFIGV